MLKVTLVKSLIGNTPRNRATVKALGLRKISQSSLLPDNPAIRGMIHKVKHLLSVTVVEDEPAKKAKAPKAEAAAAPAPKKTTRKTAKKAEETQEA